MFFLEPSQTGGYNEAVWSDEIRPDINPRGHCVSFCYARRSRTARYGCMIVENRFVCKAGTVCHSTGICSWGGLEGPSAPPDLPSGGGSGAAAPPPNPHHKN